MNKSTMLLATLCALGTLGACTSGESDGTLPDGDDAKAGSAGKNNGKGGASSGGTKSTGGSGSSGTSGTSGSSGGTGGSNDSGGSSNTGGSAGSGTGGISGNGGSAGSANGGEGNNAGEGGEGGSGGGEPGNTLCSDETPYANCQVTDFSKEDIRDNPNWEITTWASANRRHTIDNVWVENGAMVMKVNGGTPKGQQTVGAEIISKKRFLYGSFRTMAKTTSEPGTVNSPLFYYLNDESEIDVEILSEQNPRRLVNYTIHENTLGPRTHQTFDLGFDPSADFHEYRFDWTPTEVKYYVDGKHTVTLNGNVPSDRGALMLNHWTLSDPGWGGGPPVGDAFMYVKYIEIYYD